MLARLHPRSPGALFEPMFGYSDALEDLMNLLLGSQGCVQSDQRAQQAPAEPALQE